MRVARAEEMNQEFADAYNSGRMERLLELYEPDAVLVPMPGAEPVVGLEAIAASLAVLLSMGGRMESVQRYCLPFGDVALLRAEHQVTGARDADGNPVTIRGSSAEIVRRQADGTWKYIVDHPFGAGADLAEGVLAGVG